MFFPALDLVVEDDAVETLLGRLAQQLVRKGDVLLSREAEAVNDFFNLVLRSFNAFGNLHFLLAGEQGHLAHLFQVHADRIIKDVQPPLFFFRIDLGLLDVQVIHFRLVHDLDLEIAQFDENIIHFRMSRRRRQCFLDVAVGQITLLLREPDELFDFFGDFGGEMFVPINRTVGGMAVLRDWSVGWRRTILRVESFLSRSA